MCQIKATCASDVLSFSKQRIRSESLNGFIRLLESWIMDSAWLEITNLIIAAMA